MSGTEPSSDTDKYRRAAWQVEVLREDFRGFVQTLREVDHRVDVLEADIANKAGSKSVWAVLALAFSGLGGQAILFWNDANVIHERLETAVGDLRRTHRELGGEGDPLRDVRRRVAELETEIERLKKTTAKK